MKMSNNQDNTKNTIYQYNVTANSNINFDIKNQQNQIPVKVLKPSLTRTKHGPALERATKALKLINPFKGV